MNRPGPHPDDEAGLDEAALVERARRGDREAQEVLVRRHLIVPRFENVIETLGRQGAIPATVNLVTGPSRTADIEQTIERGAHGPRELCILIAG